MKKVALVLFGSVGFKEKPKDYSDKVLDPEICFESIKNFILNKFDVDVFIHSWSSPYDEKVSTLYKPKKILIEKQINFETNLDDYSLSYIDLHDEIGDLKYMNEKPSDYLKNFIFRTKSRWYSQLKSLELMKDFKIENNINYEIVIQSRLDLILKYQDFESLDSKYINLVDAPHQNKNQLFDIFFVSNYENSIKFLNIKDKLNKYPICPTNVLPIFFKDQKIDYQKSLKLDNFILHRNLYKYYRINIFKKIYKFLIARTINILSCIAYFSKKTQLILNKFIN